MTLSTNKKNIEKIVKSILSSNGIDSLKAEIDITSAWHRYVTDREEGKTPAEIRQGIAAEFTENGTSKIGQERNITRQEFMDVMKIDFGSENSADWTALLDFLVKAKAKGETIQKFAEWCLADPYNSPKAHQIAQKPLLVKQLWNLAFSEKGPEQPKQYERSSMLRILSK